MSENIRDFYLKLFPLKITNKASERTFKDGEKVFATLKSESGFSFDIEYKINLIKKEVTEDYENDEVIIRPYENLDTHIKVASYGIDENEKSYSSWLYSAFVHIYCYEKKAHDLWLKKNKKERSYNELYFPSIFLHIFNSNRVIENRAGSYFEDLIYRNRSHGTSNIGDFYFEAILHPSIIRSIETPHVTQFIDIFVRDKLLSIEVDFKYLDQPEEYSYYKKINGLHRALCVEEETTVSIKLNIEDIQHSYNLTEREKSFILSHLYILIKDKENLANFIYDGEFYSTDPFSDDEKGVGVYKTLLTYKSFYIRHKEYQGIYSNTNFLENISSYSDDQITKLSQLTSLCVEQFKHNTELIKFNPKDTLFTRSNAVIEPRLLDLVILNENSSDEYFDITVKCRCKINEVKKYDGTITLDHSNVREVSEEEFITLRLHHEYNNVLSMETSVVESTFDKKFGYEITPSDLHVMTIEAINQIMYMSSYDEEFFEDYIDIYLSVYHLQHISIEDDNIPHILGEILVDKVIYPCDESDISLCIDSHISDYIYGSNNNKDKEIMTAHGFFYSPDILSYEDDITQRKKMYFTVNFAMDGNKVTSIETKSFDTYDVEFLSEHEDMENADYEMVRFVSLHIIISSLIDSKGIYWVLGNEKEIYQSILNL